MHSDYNQLKDFKDNHACPSDDNDLSNKLVAAERKNQKYRTQLTKQAETHQAEQALAVANKEQEIINKIITDLALNIPRERESILEAVIAEIKNKITPPATDSQLNQLKEQLKNKEKIISELCQSNQNQLDLEQLVAQKEAENKELITAENELKNQLNEKQKELLAKILTKSGTIKDKVMKEEIIKVIETSLTNQGINSQKFRQEINFLSSLTDIEKLQSKYTGQKISQLEKSQKNALYLNYGLGALSLGSLLVLIYLLIKI